MSPSRLKVPSLRIARKSPQLGAYQPFPFRITSANKLEVLKSKITPLHNIPYTEQVASKESLCKNALRLIARELYRLRTPVRLDLTKLPCPVAKITGSSILTGYRNKDEFSIWRGYDEKLTVGHTPFPLRLHGDTICIEPNGCDVMKEETIKVANIAQEFIRNQAKLPISFKLGYQGGWRRLGVRTNTKGELMVVGYMSPTSFKVQEIVDERLNFRDFMVKHCETAGLKLESLYFQPCQHNKCLHSDVPYELLHGQKCITEFVEDLQFLLSPESYFPQNTLGAATLYKTTVTLIQEAFTIEPNSSRKPLIIQANCGAGFLSSYLSGIGSKIIGVDKSVQAIADAKESAKLNKIPNLEFLNVSFEIAINRIIEKYSNRRDDSIVVVVAPNSGLGNHWVQAIRECRSIRRLVYITSKVDGMGARNDLIDFCKKDPSGRMTQFVPLAAAPVDITPHLDSCELIIALERCSAHFNGAE